MVLVLDGGHHTTHYIICTHMCLYAAAYALNACKPLCLLCVCVCVVCCPLCACIYQRFNENLGAGNIHTFVHRTLSVLTRIYYDFVRTLYIYIQTEKLRAQQNSSHAFNMCALCAEYFCSALIGNPLLLSSLLQTAYKSNSKWHAYWNRWLPECNCILIGAARQSIHKTPRILIRNLTLLHHITTHH